MCRGYCSDMAFSYILRNNNNNLSNNNNHRCSVYCKRFSIIRGSVSHYYAFAQSVVLPTFYFVVWNIFKNLSLWAHPAARDTQYFSKYAAHKTIRVNYTIQLIIKWEIKCFRRRIFTQYYRVRIRAMRLKKKKSSYSQNVYNFLPWEFA